MVPQFSRIVLKSEIGKWIIEETYENYKSLYLSVREQKRLEEYEICWKLILSKVRERLRLDGSILSQEESEALIADVKSYLAEIKELESKILTIIKRG